MADLSEQNLGDKQQQFESEQLRAVEALYHHTDGDFDLNDKDTAKFAKDIGLITDPARDAIRKVWEDGGASVFGEVLSSQKDSGPEAFKRAFEIVYGRFLFEQNPTLDEATSNKATAILRKVLRFRIDDETGLKGRSELQAALRRLSMISASRKGGKSVSEELARVRDNKQKTEEKLPKLEAKGEFLTDRSADVNGLDISTDIDSLFSQLDDFKTLGEIRTLLKGIKKTLDTHRCGSEALARADAFIAEFDSLFQGNEVDVGALRAFSETGIRNFIKYLSGLFVMKFKAPKTPRPGIIYGGSVLQAQVDKLKDAKKHLEAKADEIAKNKYVTGSDVPRRKSIVEKLTSRRDSIQTLKDNSQLAEYAPGISTACKEYLDKLDAFLPSAYTLPTHADLRKFYDNEYKPFIKSIRDFMQIAIDDNDAELDTARRDISDFEDADARFSGFGSGKLEERFKEEKGKNIKELERKRAIAEEKRSGQERLIDKLKARVEYYQSVQQTTPEDAKELELANKHLKSLEEQLKAAEGIGSLDRQIEAMRNMTIEDWLLNHAFSGIRVDGDGVKIRGFEANFRHVAKSLKAAQDYFESPTEVSELRESYQDLQNLAARSGKSSLEDLLKEVGLDSKKDGINALLPKLRQSIDSKKQNIPRNPSSSDTRKMIEQKRRDHERSTDPKKGEFPEAEATKKILEPYETLRKDQSDEIAKLEQLRQTLEDTLEQAKKLHGQMRNFFKHLEIARKAGVSFGLADKDFDDLLNEFKKIDVRSTEFKPEQLTGIYAKFEEYFRSDSNVAKLADELAVAQREIASSTDLTDAQAAKKIIAAIVAKQNPDMSLADQQKLATMILADDVEKIQTTHGYEELAKRGTADEAKLDALKNAGLKAKLIGFRYREGDKDVQPFKGLKPEHFENWEQIERLFKIGRLNHQNGFFVLAALQRFDEDRGVHSLQAVKLEKRLKVALAEEMGVEEKMHQAGVNKIISKAFDAQLKKARELVGAYFAHHGRNVGEWDSNKIRELNLRYKRIREERKLGKITDEVYKHRLEKLREDAEEAEVLDRVEFSQASVMAGYWDSPHSQWMRDRGFDIGQYAKGKAAAVGKGALKLGAFGLWGATKLGLSAVTQTALAPVRLAKYPLLLAAKPFVGVINLFRRNKWTPLPTIRQAVKNDAARVAGYFKTKGGATLTGAREKITGVPSAEWKKVEYKRQKYGDRTKVELGSLQEQADELKGKAEATPVEIAGSPFINLDKYKKELDQLEKLESREAAQNTGTDAKAA